MSSESTVAQLLHLAKTRPSKADFATICARWIQSETAGGRGAVALADPHIQDIVREAQMVTACGWVPTVTPASSGGVLTIYCDGSCTNNGRSGARAGYGVYITQGGMDIKRHSERLLASEPQTNQRGELRGLQYALDYVKSASTAGSAMAVIYTDSKYSLDCLQKWSPSWEKKGWKKADGKDVLHQDVLKPMVQTFKTLSGRVTLHHVLGHTGLSDTTSKGNAVADQLACLATES